MLTFLIAPGPLVMMASLLTYGLGMTALVALRDQLTPGAPVAAWGVLCQGVSQFARLVPPALVMAGLCRLSWRCGRGWPWSFAACAVLVAVMATFRNTLTIPAGPGPGAGTWMVGFGAPSGLFPALVPVVVAVLLSWHLGEACVARSLARLSADRR